MKSNLAKFSSFLFIRTHPHDIQLTERPQKHNSGCLISVAFTQKKSYIACFQTSKEQVDFSWH